MLWPAGGSSPAMTNVGGSSNSLHLDLCVLDDLAPLRLLRLDEAHQFLGRARDRLEQIAVEERLLEFWIGEQLADLLIDLRHRVGRHPGWAEQPEPRHRLVARNGLRHGRDIR